MDPRQFDSLVRKLGIGATRRGALGAILAGVIAPIVSETAEADRKKGKGKPGRGRNNGKAGTRGKGRGQKKRGDGAARSEESGGACRGEGHPCEGNQQCCDDLVCIVSGPGNAERCTPCGAAGQPCCDDDACGDGAICDDGECVGCGGTGLSCCEGSVCDDGFNCDEDGFCVACGGDGLTCCDEGDACGEGLTCSQGNQCVACGGVGLACCAEGDACVGDDLVCNADGECETCGGDGDLCCAGGTCDTGFTCDPDGIACVVCGAAAGQLCCDTGDPCGTALVCSGGSCTPCGAGGQTCCAGDVCGDDLVCDEDGVCASCAGDEVICVTDGVGQCVPGVCCEEGDGPGCDPGETCIAGGCINDNQFRIVLRWGEEPRDLDSHLWLPPASPYHVVWFDKGTLAGFPDAELDIDDVSGFGPETITIGALQEGTYLYAVHHFAGTGTIGTSGATVQVFKGANLVAAYEAPTDAPWDGQPQPPDPADPYNDGVIWWTVFQLTYDGVNAKITDIDAAATDPSPYGTPGPFAVLSAESAIPLKARVAGGNSARRRSRKARNRRRARR
jgi:hypothetical protein